MGEFKLGKRSQECFDTIHEDLQKVVTMALSLSQVDFGISEGERTVETQQRYFDTGKSKVNPMAYDTVKELLSKGKHLTDPIVTGKHILVL